MSSVPVGTLPPSAAPSLSATQAPPVMMPTRAELAVSIGRSMPASWAVNCSASGSFDSRCIKVFLQNDLRGGGVDQVLVVAQVDVLAAQILLGRRRAIALVDEFHVEAIARVKLAGEAPRPLCHFVFGAVCRERQAEHQLRGPPFGDELVNRGKAPLAILGVDGGKGMGQLQLMLADRDADAFGAKIESQYRPGRKRGQDGSGRDGHAWPTSSERLVRSMPSRRIAAGRRCSAGRSKITPVIESA